MPTRTKRTARTEPVDLASVLAWLERTGTRKTLEGMARYGIPAKRAFGVPVGVLKAYSKGIGKDHALAQALWSSGYYEARMLASFVGEPSELSAKQMDAW